MASVAYGKRHGGRWKSRWRGQPHNLKIILVYFMHFTLNLMHIYILCTMFSFIKDYLIFNTRRNKGRNLYPMILYSLNILLQLQINLHF